MKKITCLLVVLSIGITVSAAPSKRCKNGDTSTGVSTVKFDTHDRPSGTTSIRLPTRPQLIVNCDRCQKLTVFAGHWQSDCNAINCGFVDLDIL